MNRARIAEIIGKDAREIPGSWLAIMHDMMRPSCLLYEAAAYVGERFRGSARCSDELGLAWKWAGNDIAGEIEAR